MWSVDNRPYRWRRADRPTNRRRQELPARNHIKCRPPWISITQCEPSKARSRSVSKVFRRLRKKPRLKSSTAKVGHLILLTTAPLQDRDRSSQCRKVTRVRSRPSSRSWWIWCRLTTTCSSPAPGALHLDRRHAPRRRGQGFFRALAEQRELWAIDRGFDGSSSRREQFLTCAARWTTCASGRALRTAASATPSRRVLSKKLLPEMISTLPQQESRRQGPV